jgi:hypothetical protein
MNRSAVMTGKKQQAAAFRIMKVEEPRTMP